MLQFLSWNAVLPFALLCTMFSAVDPALFSTILATNLPVTLCIIFAFISFSSSMSTMSTMSTTSSMSTMSTTSKTSTRLISTLCLASLPRLTAAFSPLALFTTYSIAATLLLFLTTLIITGMTYLAVCEHIRASNPLHPPTVTPNTKIPLIGHFKIFTFLEFSASPLRMIHRCYKDYGPAFTLNMFGQKITILLTPDAQEPFFKSPDTGKRYKRQKTRTASLCSHTYKRRSHMRSHTHVYHSPLPGRSLRLHEARVRRGRRVRLPR